MFFLRHYGVVAATVSTTVLTVAVVVGSASFARESYSLQLAATSASLPLAALAIAVLLIGASHIRRRSVARQASERAADVRDRGRIAGELHDGLAQDLAYIALQARAADPTGDTSEALEHIAAAAQRALDASRRAIEELRDPPRPHGEPARESARVLLKPELRLKRHSSSAIQPPNAPASSAAVAPGPR